MVNARILIVEDEGIIAEDVRWRLRNLGYTVPAVVASGKEALKKAKELKLDLVLMDIMLRGTMDGIETAAQIRSQYDIPVVFMTSYADEKTVERAKKTEPFGYIIKPVEEKKLQSVISIALYKYTMERKLRESEEKYRLITETSIDGIYQVDTTGKFVFVNKSFVKMFGYPRKDLIGKNFAILLPSKSIPLLQKWTEEVLSGKAVKNEVHAKHKKGYEVQVILSAVPITKGGKIVGLTGIMKDITERREVEKTLEYSRASFHNIVEKNADGIIIVDKNGIVRFVNPTAETIFKRKAEELIGELFGFALSAGEYTEIDIVRGGGETGTGEMQVVETEWEEEPANLISIRDISERKQAEERVKAANKKLKELNQLKSDFVSTVSHELRTPISIIRESVDLCLDGAGGELTNTHKKFLTSAQNNIDRLTRLVTDLLDISKIESKKLTLRRNSINLWNTAQKIHKSYIPQAKNKGIHLELKKAFHGKTLRLYVDEDKVYQILNNLLTNALRYTESGGKITIEVKDREDFVEFSVSDTGNGIAKENIPKLFSKFEQFGRAEGPGYKGTGLGLAICKGLVEKHGGKIWAESQLGKGTTFRFTLKKAPFPKILIVDDEEDAAEMIKIRLSLYNYRTAVAYDGNTAIEIACNEDISLIILDIRLPEMNGYEVIGRLKQNKRTQNIPIIVMSAYPVDEKRLVDANLNAAIPIIDKQIEPTELMATIKDLLIG